MTYGFLLASLLMSGWKVTYKGHKHIVLDKPKEKYTIIMYEKYAHRQEDSIRLSTNNIHSHPSEINSIKSLQEAYDYIFKVKNSKRKKE